MSNRVISRKQDVPQLKELFTALLKLNDLDLQNRVLDAINGIHQSANRNVLKLTEVDDKSTQTCREDFEMILISNCSNLNSVNEGEKKNIRKRKRKLRGPRVGKSCTEVKKVLIKNDRSIKISHNDENSADSSQINKQYYLDNLSKSDFDPFMNILGLDNNSIEEILLPSRTQENLLKKMMLDYQKCRNFTDGQLPIHEAIFSGDFNKLKRQLYIFKFLKIDLSEILVEVEDEDYNLLQFTIISKSKSNFFKEIFDYQHGILFEKDSKQNNLIHLAIEFLDENSDNDLFETLINCFQLESLKYFEETNASGQTVFHMCVKKNKSIFCKILVKRLDELLGFDTDESKNKKLKIDSTEYTNFKTNISNLGEYSYDWQQRKYQIINKIDITDGSTPLNQAVQVKNEELIMILLKNLADINLKNYAGLSALEYCENDRKIYKLLTEFESPKPKQDK